MEDRMLITSRLTAILSAAGLLWGASGNLQSASVVPAADTIRIENGHIRIGFSPDNGRLLELVHAHSGLQFVSASADGDLWRLDLLPAGAVDAVTPAEAGTFRVERPADSQLRLIWSEFGIDAAPHLEVVVDLGLRSGEAMSEWRIALESFGALAVYHIRFPRLPAIARLGAEEHLAMPQWMGVLTRQPREILTGEGDGRRIEWAYPGIMSLQMLTFYSPGGLGLYLAADDTLSYRKSFGVWGDGAGNVGYEMIHAVEDAGATRARYAPRYNALIGTFEGDWITAAKTYREWGTRQRWARESRLTRGLVPEWLLDTGIWVWNRGRSPGVLPPATTLARETGLPVRVFWHWWHSGRYDADFPEYLPPREGSEHFQAAVRNAQEHDVRSMVYMNQRLWCTGTDSWRQTNAERYAVKTVDGSTWSHVYNIFDEAPCAAMDLIPPFWRDVYAGMADELFGNYGIDALYMDQAVSSFACYDPNHGHPVGGGNYWMDGFSALTQDIRTGQGWQPDRVLAGEGGGENWLPELDLFLTLQISRERYAQPLDGWEVIPFFQAVYHAHAVTYGNYSSLTMPPYDDLWPAAYGPTEPLALLDRRYRTQFYLEQARAFVWGMQPLIANFLPSHLEERPTEMEYVIRLANTRIHALDYLLFGTFLRPPPLDVPEIGVEFSRISIYAAQLEGITRFEHRHPAVLAGAWRAPTGNVGVALAGIVEEPLSINVAIDPAAYQLQGGGTVYLIDDSGRRRIGEFNDQTVTIPVDLPPLGVFVLELKRTGA
jgi:hypothetical protein